MIVVVPFNWGYSMILWSPGSWGSALVMLQGKDGGWRGHGGMRCSPKGQEGLR